MECLESKLCVRTDVLAVGFAIMSLKHEESHFGLPASGAKNVMHLFSSFEEMQS